MRIESRLLLALAALLLAPVFYLPLWSIRIVAPQYRDGLGLYIGLRDIWGHTQHDLQNINILNHYIGMKPIDPAAVDVLTIMPWAAGILIAGALLVAVLGRRWLVVAWLATFALIGGAGLFEFYSWNHDYGTNLSPTAPIKVPGMTYEPPIFGTKQLLNMTTTSFPSWGTLFVLLALVAGALALVNERFPLFGRRGVPRLRGSPRESRSPARAAAAAAALAVVLVIVAAGCQRRPAGEDVTREAPAFAPEQPPCAYCEGAIPESRFGGQLVTTNGERFRFMSVECLVGFLLEERVPRERIAALQVVDYNHGERLIDATTARYVRMQFERSPSGLDLAAVETEKVQGTLQYFLGGEKLTWEQVLAYVQREWEL